MQIQTKGLLDMCGSCQLAPILLAQCLPEWPGKSGKSIWSKCVQLHSTNTNQLHTQIYITRKHNSPTHLENGLAAESTSLCYYYLASFTLQKLSLAFLAELLEVPNSIVTEPALAWEYSHFQLCRSGIDILYSQPVTQAVHTLLEEIQELCIVQHSCATFSVLG